VYCIHHDSRGLKVASNRDYGNSALGFPTVPCLTLTMRNSDDDVRTAAYVSALVLPWSLLVSCALHGDNVYTLYILQEETSRTIGTSSTSRVSIYALPPRLSSCQFYIRIFFL